MPKNYKFVLFTLLSAIVLSSCNRASQEVIVSPSNDNIQFQGRTDHTHPDSVLIYWPGSQITFKFKGTGAKAALVDEKGENYFHVIVDGKPEKVLQLAQGDSLYQLAENLKDTVHILSLYKRTEAHEGGTAFTKLWLTGKSTLLPPPEKPDLKILFYGNSITSGMGNEDTSRIYNDSSFFKNNYLAYGAITARNLDAQYQSISLSGIGITISWFDLIMPEVFNRINPLDSTSIYDMQEYNPDIVVINLFQNDSWLINRPDHEQFLRRFPDGEKPGRNELIQAYLNFSRTLMAHYPNAHFIFALGSMDATREASEWPGIVTESVQELKQLTRNEKLHTVYFPYTRTPAHPVVKEHKAMAELLTTYILENILTQE